MLIIFNNEFTVPLKMSSIHTGVKKMTIIPRYLSNQQRCLIMGDDKGPLSKPIFVGTEQNSGIYTTIEFSNQPYGYPDLSSMFWTGLGFVLVETDDDYVSADDYFRLG